MEKFKMTVKRRDLIWNEIKNAIETHKEKEIRDILFDGNKGMVDDLVTIDQIITAHEELLKNWDKFLHCGKTEKEENEERFKPIRERMEKQVERFTFSPLITMDQINDLFRAT